MKVWYTRSLKQWNGDQQQTEYDEISCLDEGGEFNMTGLLIEISFSNPKQKQAGLGLEISFGQLK